MRPWPGTAIEALAALPGLAGAVVRGAGGVLVLDDAGARVVDASGPAAALVEGSAGDGGLPDGPLAAQLAALARDLPATGGPRLERLRLTRDRLAPPLVCSCLRADLPAHGTVLVVALPGSAAARTRRDRDAAPPEPAAAPTVDAAGDGPSGTDAAPPPAETARPSLRFLWRSDAEGRLIEVSAPLADRVRGGVVGRTWDELLAGTVADPDGRLAAALAARETFRTLPVRWRVGAGPHDLAVELSATLRPGPDGAFGGFQGFGRVEAAAPLDPPPEPDTALEPPRQENARPAPAPAPDAAFPAFASLAGAAMAGFAGMMSAPFGFGWQGATAPPAPTPPPTSPTPPADLGDASPRATTVEAHDLGGRDVDPAPLGEDAPDEDAQDETAPTDLGFEPPADETGMGGAETPAAEPDPQAPGLAALSLGEHHAFREIARALGARFAGDEGPAEEAPAVPAAPVAQFPAPTRPVRDAEPDAGGEDARGLLDRLPIGTLVHRGETALYANRAFLETVGYADVPELQDDGGVARLFRSGAHGRGSVDAAAVGVSTKSGATVPVEVRLTTVPWGGDPAALMLVRRLPDVDPAQRAAALELDLAAARARAAEALAILDAGADAVVTFDARARLTSLNRRASALFGYDAREVAGEPLSLLVAGEGHPGLHALVEAARTGAAATGPLVGRDRGGALVPLDARLARIGEAADGVYCALLSDATAARADARARTEAERRAELAVDRAAAFLERAGHDIRTPLNAMLGFAEIMIEERFGPVGSERYRGYLRDLHAAGSRVVGLVGDLMELARLEAGRGAMKPEPVDLNAVAAESVARFQGGASKARIIVRTSFAPGLPPVLVDRSALAQIAANLVANAIQFTEAGGQVIVSTGSSEGGGAVLRVRDTGIGMSPAQIEAALDPFRPARADAGRRAPERGAGLGLPLTRALAAANGASLDLQSRVGEGTLVELVLPAAGIAGA